MATRGGWELVWRATIPEAGAELPDRLRAGGQGEHGVVGLALHVLGGLAGRLERSWLDTESAAYSRR